jgi:transposase
MQDGAPGHAAAETMQELHERGIYPIFWPAYSPDLNPIDCGIE